MTIRVGEAQLNMSRGIDLLYYIFLITAWFLEAIYFTQCLRVIPERVNMTYVNPKYLEWANISIKRYGRKSDYYINLNGALLAPWSNNITIDIIFYELLHNEYKRSFVEMHFKLCDMLNKDPYVGKIFASRGFTCPILPKEYFLSNISVPTENFPHVWPFEKSRVFVYLKTDKKEDVVNGYGDVLFKSNKKSGT